MIDYGSHMYDDVKRGCSTRELENKYNCSILSVSTYIKRVDSLLWNNESSPIYGMKDEIKKYIDSMIILNGGNSGN